MILEAYVTPHLDENVYGYWLIVERWSAEEEEYEELACSFFATRDEAEEYCENNFGVTPEFLNK